MIRISENTPKRVTFVKETREETWFDDNCSDENLLKMCNREGDAIKRVQFDDGRYIGSILYVYFEEKKFLNVENEKEKNLETLFIETNRNSFHEFENADFQKISRCHDWRNYVPDELVEEWYTLSERERKIIFIMAVAQAEKEEWD